MYNSAFNFGAGSNSQGAALRDIFSRVSTDAQSGRPGSLDYLMRLFDTIGQAEQLGQGQYSFQQMSPYMTDESERARQRFGWESQLRGYQIPYAQQYYQQAGQDLTSPYRQIMTPFPSF